MSVYLSTTARNAALDSVLALLNGGASGGLLRVYSGTRPGNADVGVTDQVLLATLTFSDPAFTSADGGIATANTIAEDAAADATGTATWGRMIDSAGAVVMDVSVGTFGTTVILNTANIVAGAVVRIVSASFTMPQ